jgi:hypothetical protein
MHFDVGYMDSNHDGMITKDQYMKYGEAKWDKLPKDKSGIMSTADATKNFARGNVKWEVKTTCRRTAGPALMRDGETGLTSLLPQVRPGRR